MKRLIDNKSGVSQAAANYMLRHGLNLWGWRAIAENHMRRATARLATSPVPH